MPTTTPGTKAAGRSPDSSKTGNNMNIAENSAAASGIDSSEPGSVSRLRQNWAVHEDGALAHKLQSQEYQSHLCGNKQRNNQIRQDFPTALEEQTRELTEAELIYRDHLRVQREIEERDQEVARKVAQEQERAEGEHRRYEATRDEVFARRIQSMEATRLQQQQQASRSVQQRGGNNPFSATRAVVHRPEPEGTPPLPVMANGDVPFSAEGAMAAHPSSSHRRTGNMQSSNVRSNPHSRENSSIHSRDNPSPSMRNNAVPSHSRDNSFQSRDNPSHSRSNHNNPFQSRDNNIPSHSRDNSSVHSRDNPSPSMRNNAPQKSNPFHPRDNNPTITLAEETTARGGLRYNDEQYLVKMARPAMIHAEPVYANNKPEHYAVSNPFPADDGAVGGMDLSPELLGAAGLSQRDLVLSKRVEAQLEQEKRDMELARRLQEQLSSEEFDLDRKAETEAKDLELARQLHAKEKAKLKRAKERARLKKQMTEEAVVLEDASQPSQASAARPLQDYSNNANVDSRSNSRMSSNEFSLPARRPYMNRDAIESHVSGCSDSEPQYENLRPPVPQVQVTRQYDQDEGPVPPYMPMQQASSKKTSSLEKRISRKKEKEGCKQQ